MTAAIDMTKAKKKKKKKKKPVQLIQCSVGRRFLVPFSAITINLVVLEITGLAIHVLTWQSRSVGASLETTMWIPLALYLYAFILFKRKDNRVEIKYMIAIQSKLLDLIVISLKGFLSYYSYRFSIDSIQFTISPAFPRWWRN